jgi:hypothetical protein
MVKERWMLLNAREGFKRNGRDTVTDKKLYLH